MKIMLDKAKLESEINEVGRMIDEQCVDPAGKKHPIGDGIVNIDCYLKAKFKILVASQIGDLSRMRA